MIEWKKLRTTLLGLLVVAILGYAFRFESLTTSVQAIERKQKKVEDYLIITRELHCAIATELFYENEKPQEIGRHCTFRRRK